MLKNLGIILFLCSNSIVLSANKDSDRFNNGLVCNHLHGFLQKCSGGTSPRMAILPIAAASVWTAFCTPTGKKIVVSAVVPLVSEFKNIEHNAEAFRQAACKAPQPSSKK
jgi:hypothetical protein